MFQIALIGDYSPEITAHRAIPLALERAAAELGQSASWQWVLTRDLQDPPRDLAGCAGVWVTPGSPYENTPGVLAAIRWARETHRPLLGTCGGFQHALIEFARNVLGLTAADHAETNPHGGELVVTRLTCSLVERTQQLHFLSGSRVQAAYGADSAEEGYHCNYGPAPAYRGAFERAGLRFTAFDEDGAIRAAELPVDVHPFFVGTLFQPERAALAGRTPPLARAFVAAARK